MKSVRYSPFFINSVSAILVLLGVSGCQTTASSPVVKTVSRAGDQSEKLLMRVDKIVGTYSVSVQRVEHHGTNPKASGEWDIAGAAEVSCYPGSFRKSDGTAPVDSASRKGTFLLDGITVEVALESGVQLVLKVEPKLENTARIIGVFSQTRPTEAGMETFSLPFDVECDLGAVTVLYAKDVSPKSVEGLLDIP